ncbi:uncharacterized protein LOC127704562 [Mytilus californianus]|uniref:uncharacterized protein LOC127704562 n=1 Tax=Mytilus californianus TaxID=6549 RepID=UPI002246D8F8|nr:uncharacterized protein LOC127704562 [Mytilus californianus]
MDFAENFSCFSQNEIQGAHWAKDSVTIHPVIARYQCKNQECYNSMVDDIIDIISNDLQHDVHAVQKFTEVIIKFLREERGIDVEKMFILSDGCAAQYKSKVAFLDSSMSEVDNNIKSEKAFYGSRHGKNRCDGEGGVIKSKAARIIRNGGLINSAKDLYEQCLCLQKELTNPDGTCNHNRRKLIWVERSNIRHVRPNRVCKTVKGTRSLHSVRGIGAGQIQVRRLACFCGFCTATEHAEGTSSTCENEAVVGEWRSVNLNGFNMLNRNDIEQDIENRNDEEQDIENRNDEEQDIENRNDEEQDIENRNDEEQDIENRNDEEQDIENRNDEEQDIENRNDEEQDIENRNDEEQDIENRNDEEQDIENRNDEELDIENEQNDRDDDDEIVNKDGPDLNMLNRNYMNDEEQDNENEQDNRDDDDEIVTKDGPDDFLGSDLFTELPELKDTSMTSLNFNNMSFSDADCEKESFNAHDSFIDQFINWNHENTENVEHVQEKCIPSRFLNGHGLCIISILKMENGWMVGQRIPLQRQMLLIRWIHQT